VNQTTRIVSKVAAGDMLRCTCCELWKGAAANFNTRSSTSGHGGEPVPSYETRCRPCDSLSTRLGSIAAARKALNLGLAGVLRQARHGGRTDAKPLSTKAKEELRERREEAAGTPSMCYLLGMEGDRTAVKIGSSTNVYRRMAQIQAGNPRKLKVLGLLPGGEAKERELHKKFMRYHRPEFIGEWFAVAPEIFNHFARGRISRSKLEGLPV
jgi:hypothetical protein